jgi:hypothetical protein
MRSASATYADDGGPYSCQAAVGSTPTAAATASTYTRNARASAWLESGLIWPPRWSATGRRPARATPCQHPRVRRIDGRDPSPRGETAAARHIHRQAVDQTHHTGESSGRTSLPCNALDTLAPDSSRTPTAAPRAAGQMGDLPARVHARPRAVSARPRPATGSVGLRRVRCGGSGSAAIRGGCLPVADVSRDRASRSARAGSQICRGEGMMPRRFPPDRPLPRAGRPLPRDDRLGHRGATVCPPLDPTRRVNRRRLPAPRRRRCGCRCLPAVSTGDPGWCRPPSTRCSRRSSPTSRCARRCPRPSSRAASGRRS